MEACSGQDTYNDRAKQPPAFFEKLILVSVSCIGLNTCNIYVSWSTSELRVGLAPLNRFKPSRTIPRRYFFCGSFMCLLSCVCYVFLCVYLYVLFGHLLGKSWPIGSRLWCLTEFVTFPLISWVRCGTWLYRFLISAPLITYNKTMALLAL